jgi:SAM-dependent methyltransferase
MDYRDYSVLKNNDSAHFWHRARLLLIEKILSHNLRHKTANRRILDLGCGTGSALAIINKFGSVEGADSDDNAIAVARQAGWNIHKLDLGRDTLPADSFEAICCFDLLEHLKDDEGALRMIFSAVKKGGFLFFSIPSFGFLLSPHDLALGHFRRYNKAQLKRKIVDSGFGSVEQYYWNTILFLPIAVLRIIKSLIFIRLLKADKHVSESRTLYGPINRILFSVLNLETDFLFRNKYLPFGLSIYGWAKK